MANEQTRPNELYNFGINWNEEVIYTECGDPYYDYEISFDDFIKFADFIKKERNNGE